MKGRVSFVPEEGERALTVGQTGSGKTAFNVWLMERIPQAPGVLYDTKDEPKFDALPNSRVVTTQEDCSDAIDDVSVDYVIFRPPAHLLGDPERLDDFLWYHYNHYKGVWCYIDEAQTFHRGSTAFKGLIALMARGRSRNITTILSTQRPARISRSLISEATKIYVFRLADRRDRKTLAEVIPDFDREPLPPKYGFYFFESGEDEAQLMEPVPLDKKYDTGYVDKSAETGDETQSAEVLSKHIWI